MALASDRQAALVDPSQGLYVEMEGVMEVRYLNDYGESYMENEDFFNFQNRRKHIPDDFCHKDRDSGTQAVFFCLVCDCDLKSVKSLGDHAKGNKHIRKALEKKRQVLGQPLEPQNAPRVKKIKKEQPRIDVNKTLEERLRDSAQPAVGLNFIQEFRNPEDRSAHRMYSCVLEGCKSAWGTSDDIYNHVIKYKHARNFFKFMHPEDARIAGLSNADILEKATELHEQEGGSDETDYGVIEVFKDYQKWKELRDRPDNWSEKKARLGLVVGNFNSNLEPLGERKGRNLGGAEETRGGGSRNDYQESRRRSSSPSIFDEEAWKGWRPKTLLSRCKEFMDCMEDAMNDVKEEVEKFEGNEDSEEFKTFKWMLENYRRDLDLHENYKAPPEIGQQRFDMKMIEWKDIMDKAEGEMMEKLDQEERSVKHVGGLLQEVEDEMENYGASRDSKKYQNIKVRMSEMTKEMSNLKPSKDINKIRKEEFNKRMAALWQRFEQLSDIPSNISSILESQMNKSSQPNKETAVKAYEIEISSYVRSSLEKYRSGPNRKIGDERELEALTKYISQKVIAEEIKVFEKSRCPWIQFKMRDPTKKNIDSYLINKMNRHVMGSY